jgi:hypothetical protein
MKFIEPISKFFESVNMTNDQILEFLTDNSDFKDPRAYQDKFATKYQITKDGVDIYGDISFSNRGLEAIPFNFRNVSGKFNCSGNKFNSFEFLPIECKKYLLGNNPGFDGVLKGVWTKTRIMGLDATEQSQQNLEGFFNLFIQECLNNNIWSNGITNWDLMGEVLSDTKLIASSNDKDFISKFGLLIDYSDREILSEYLKVKNYTIDEVVNRILNIVKESDGTPFSNFEILYNIWLDNKTDCEEIFNNWDINDTILSLFELIRQKRSEFETKGRYIIGNNHLENLIKKIRRSQEDIEFEKEYDTFIFIGRYKYIEQSDGNFKRKLEIENLYKIDKYNPDDQSTFNMMRMRARMHSDSKLYFIHIPKGALEDKSYTEVPEYLVDLIDKKKTAI